MQLYTKKPYKDIDYLPINTKDILTLINDTYQTIVQFNLEQQTLQTFHSKLEVQRLNLTQFWKTGSMIFRWQRVITLYMQKIEIDFICEDCNPEGLQNKSIILEVKFPQYFEHPVQNMKFYDPNLISCLNHYHPSKNIHDQ